MNDRLGAYDYDTQKMVFSAAAIMSIFFLICIVVHWVLYIFFGIAFISTLWTGYKIFIKPRGNDDKAKITINKR